MSLIAHFQLRSQEVGIPEVDGLGSTTDWMDALSPCQSAMSGASVSQSQTQELCWIQFGADKVV